VAVKIQRPGIEKVVDVDLDILSGLAHLAEKYLREARHFDLSGMVNEFRTKLKIELNFRRELLHIQKFENLFRGREEIIRIPRAHPEYSTRRILTMDYIEGIKVSRVKSQEAIAYDEELLAGRIAELMMEQVFIHGFFHADPHPGNVLVLEDNVVCFLDFGMMGRIRPREQEALSVMLLGIVNRDAAKVTDSLLFLTRRTGPVDLEELEVRIYDLLEEYIDLSLEDFDITAMFTDLITLIRSFGLIIPSNILFMSKAIIAVEGIGRYLYPEFSLFRLFKPFSRKLIREQFRPEKVMTELYETGMKYKGFLEDLPADGGDLLKQMKDGRFRIGFRLLGLEKLRRSLERTGLRFITGMSIAGLVIGSSLLVSAGTPPLYRGIPVLALVGYGISALLGLGTLISAVRRAFK
jgi:ubiquinone biosynthesis protein